MSSNAYGDVSLAVGNGAVAGVSESSTTVINDLAIGTGASATGTNAVAVGSGSVASGSGGMSVGTDSMTTGSGSTALGNGAAAGLRHDDRQGKISAAAATG
nr:hypothetical protein [Burkholderia pyrrocinia]